MSRPDIAVYYFPEYHPDPRNDAWHGHGWTEWELLKLARPRFEGHRQPIVPAWGYFDESDPTWSAREIDLAADHGIDVFIYDWYWWEDGPFLQDGLENGFLNAPNRNRLKFALMWANHDWIDIHPSKFTNKPELLSPGGVSEDAFERLTDHVVGSYFSRPNYWLIDGQPYFSIYEIDTFINGIGGLNAARRALDRFRRKTVDAGLPGLHLNVIHRGMQVLPIESASTGLGQVIEALGVSSVGSYVWVHHSYINGDGFPWASHARIAAENYAAWERHKGMFSVPYHPNVTMGWDSSPRTVQSDVYEERGYTWTSVMRGSTPDAFREALERVREFIERPDVPQKIISINAWNEWTEGSYLLPDTVHGTAYLEAIRDVFSTRP